MEWHVAGVLARTRPGEADAVTARIAAVPGAQVHAGSADGKLVVTLEAPGAAALAALLARIALIAGVLSAVLVYQHHEPLEDRHDGPP